MDRSRELRSFGGDECILALAKCLDRESQAVGFGLTPSPFTDIERMPTTGCSILDLNDGSRVAHLQFEEHTMLSRFFFDGWAHVLDKGEGWLPKLR